MMMVFVYKTRKQISQGFSVISSDRQSMRKKPNALGCENIKWKFINGFQLPSLLRIRFHMIAYVQLDGDNAKLLKRTVFHKWNFPIKLIAECGQHLFRRWLVRWKHISGISSNRPQHIFSHAHVYFDTTVYCLNWVGMGWEENDFSHTAIWHNVKHRSFPGQAVSNGSIVPMETSLTELSTTHIQQIRQYFRFCVTNQQHRVHDPISKLKMI